MAVAPSGLDVNAKDSQHSCVVANGLVGPQKNSLSIGQSFVVAAVYRELQHHPQGGLEAFPFSWPEGPRVLL